MSAVTGPAGSLEFDEALTLWQMTRLVSPPEAHGLDTVDATD